MKKLTLLLALVLGLVGFYFLRNQTTFPFALAQSNCCNPPLHGPTTPRFAQGALVTVYIDSSPSGFTSLEQQLIKSGIEDWNDEPNNSGVTYNVVITSSLPPAGTNNTILVQFSDQFSSGAGGVLLNLHSSSGPGGTSIYAEMIFFNNIRNPTRPESRPEQIRAGARHEIAHGIGLGNANDCPIGSTIMNPSFAQETFITTCDNDVIDSDPNYPAPTPTPTPEPSPTPCAGENNSCTFPSDCCPGLTCGEITSRCIQCELDPLGSKGGCVSEACANCYAQGGTYCDPMTGQCWTPILIDVKGDGFRMTDSENGIRFEVFGHEIKIQTAWTVSNSDDAWLVLDRNGNGLIDNGSELFSSASPQTVLPFPQLKNGFNALAEYDKPSNGGNGDGDITTSDAIFSSLQLWQDLNHNGISEPSELCSLPALDIAVLSLNYKEARRKDRYGNTYRYRAKVTDHRGTHVGRWAWDVFPVAHP